MVSVIVLTNRLGLVDDFGTYSWVKGIKYPELVYQKLQQLLLYSQST
jgi:hypothetical protein